MLRHALFDLDNTLYSPSTGLWEAIGQRINMYMAERLGLGREEAVARRRRYRAAFGTTLNGLRQDFQVDPDEFLAYAHDLPLERYLRSDLELGEMLARLPLEKIIFTNADEPHARRVLHHLGVAEHFHRIVDIRALGFINKPDVRAYSRVLELIPARAEECVFIEDSLHNLLPARALGMITVLVGQDGTGEGADYRIRSVLALGDVVAPLLARGDSV